MADATVDNIAAPIQFRRFDDIPAQREAVYQSALSAVKGIQPLQNARFRLEVADPDYEDGGVFSPSKSDEKKAILSGGSLNRSLKATLRLINNENNEVADEQRVTLARIPHLNSRGLFIRNGVVWATRNQTRLRPGIYTRHQASGGTEAHFNVKPGTGRGFRITLEPETGLFKMQVGQSGTRLYPLLRAIGVSDDAIKEAWGPELFEANYRAPSGHDRQDIEKIVKKLGPRDVTVAEDLLPQALADILGRAEVDPETTELTLGQGIDKITPEVLVNTTRKILRVNRGEEDADNRDSQAFQSVHAAEDFIKERLSRDQVGALRKLLWKASRDGKLGKVSSGLLDKNIGAIFEGSGLAIAAEDINPFEIHDLRQAVTRLGTGGISSEQAVSRDARGVQASYIGVIDSGRGPECFDGDTEVFTRRGWVYWRDIRSSDLFAVRKAHGLGFEKANRIIIQHYWGPMHHYHSKFVDYMVTPNHRMLVKTKRSKEWRFEEAADIQKCYRRVDTDPGIYPGSKKHVDGKFISGIELVRCFERMVEPDEEYLRDEVFDWPVQERQMLLDALFLSQDFNTNHDGRMVQQTFSSASERLAKDVERLAIGLGYSTRSTLQGGTGYRVTLLKNRARVLNSASAKGTHVWDIVNWKSFVYCAEVPGGQLFVRRNGCVPFWTGNSSKLGLDLRVTDAALKGDDNKLYTTVRNARTGDEEIVSARTLSSKVVTFPGELNSGEKYIPAIKNDKIEYVSRDEVDYEVDNPSKMMSRATAMIPFPESIKGQRLLMGSRMTQQALPLKDPEAPLVQTGDITGNSLHAAMGKYVGAAYAPDTGIVLDVTKDAIKIGTPDGQIKIVDLYDNYPTARKTLIHNTPVVKKGDYVKPGQLLARSNFTDEKGTAAIGKNLRIAFMVAEGDTIEDAYVLSESAAKKLTSEALYKSDLDLSDIASTKKADYRAIYADKYSRGQYDNIDDDGVVKEGVEVKPGDPLILGFSKRTKRGVGALMNTPRAQHSDAAQEWEHHAPGIVTDVVKGRKGIKVTVKSYSEMNPGDKLTGRFGNKGVVSSIRPDDQMPLDKDGRPVEVIANSLGIVSRVNPGALAEALLGKVAAKTGEPYVIKGFNTPEGVVDFALKEALKHGVISEGPDGEPVDTETMTDPRDGRKIENIFTGVAYMMKPHHMAESKLSTRNVGGYTTEGFPARGGKEGSKRISLLDSHALLSAGATNFLKDAKLIRGQRNDDYWRSLKAGDVPSIPASTFANEQFKALLTAAGVNLREEGTQTGLSPLLDTDVDSVAPHEIENSGTFNFETMRPIAGGLFDVRATGGADGSKFSKITLPQKVPHPLFIEPIQRILGLTGKKMDAVLAGKEDFHGKTGPAAIEEALGRVNIEAEIGYAKELIRNGSRSKRDDAVKRLNYLVGLKDMNVNPSELMISKIPVIPPKYRPIVQARGMDMVHDLNYLYHDLLEAKSNYKDAESTFGSAGDEYMAMYNAVRAVTGMREPVNPKTAEQNVKGILKYAIGVGQSPKTAFYHRKVIGSAVDTVGRGVITSDPNLDMDEVGIPKEMAWSMFKPFVIRRLVRQGMPGTEAVSEVKDKTKRAEMALRAELKERPVVYNRAPALHRYAYVAAWGKIRDDDAIGMPYHTLKGIGGDFDGDSAVTSVWTRQKGGVHFSSVVGDIIPLDKTGSVITTLGTRDLVDFPRIESTAVAKRPGVTEYDVPDGVSVYAYDCNSGALTEAPVTKFSIHENLDMRAVTYGGRKGETVFVSADHSLIVYKDGVIGPSKPDDCVGLCSPVAKRLENSDPSTHATVTGLRLRGRQKKGTPVEYDIGLHRDFGYIIGCLVGDGWVDSRSSIYLAANDESVRSSYTSAVERVLVPHGGTSPKVTSFRSKSISGRVTVRHKVRYSNNLLGRWLKPHIGDGALNKRVPDFSLSASDDHLMGVLDGLLTTDGSVSLNKSRKKPQLLISYATSSPHLVNHIQLICRRLGIATSVSLSYSRVSGTDCFVVSLSTVDFKRFVARTGFTCSHAGKQSILSSNLSEVNETSSVAASADLVPYPRHLHRVFTKLFSRSLSDQLLSGHRTSATNRAISPTFAGRKNGYVSRTLMLEARKAYLSLDEKSKSELYTNCGNTPPSQGIDEPSELDSYFDSVVLNYDVTWRVIQSCEIAPACTAYDLTVPGPYTFATSSGLIVQDTINLHLPVSDEAVQDAKEKLLPSKNLFHTASFETHLEPMQDYLVGLYLASKPKDNAPVRTFATEADARKAYARGDISLRTPIRILGES